MKYYWLKLHKDFFKRHDIRIIEDMENGKDYILFYLKLLVESVSHEGKLRFSETIPYNEKMLSTITNTNIDIVRAAMKVFQELKMIDVLEDSTIYMAEVEELIGNESESAERVRKHRKNQKMLHCNANVTECNESVTQRESKSIDKELDIEIRDRESALYETLLKKYGSIFEEKVKKYKTVPLETIASWMEEKGQKFPKQEYDFEELERMKLDRGSKSSNLPKT